LHMLHTRAAATTDECKCVDDILDSVVGFGGHFISVVGVDASCSLVVILRPESFLHF